MYTNPPAYATAAPLETLAGALGSAAHSPSSMSNVQKVRVPPPLKANKSVPSVVMAPPFSTSDGVSSRLVQTGPGVGVAVGNGVAVGVGVGVAVGVGVGVGASGGSGENRQKSSLFSPRRA